MNKLQGLFNLRTKLLLNSPYHLISFLLPFVVVLICKHYFSVVDELAVLLIEIGLSLVIFFSVGPSIASVVSQEKEHSIISALMVIGVSPFKYWLSHLLLPSMLVMAASILIPIISGVNLLHFVTLNYFVVVLFIVIIFINLNFLIAILTRNQIQAQIVSNLVMLILLGGLLFQSDIVFLERIQAFSPTYLLHLASQGAHVSGIQMMALTMEAICSIILTLIASHLFFIRGGKRYARIISIEIPSHYE